jgi:hypothetical protein
LLTPRDPAFNDARNRKALSTFIQMRRAFLKASLGKPKAMRQFRKRYPNWRDLAPNRFSSHFFLVEHSDLYRRVSGEDLIDEDLDLHLLDGGDEDEKKKKNGNKKGNDKKEKENKNDNKKGNNNE